ncbi:uncharacterized protein A1O9_07537 [Exophiala aquamarina CBS 119918]|uniref:Uncharacterized protein n=1 Tax=Exophiala aquamarina CBS 119918 TaxID=1182545 RepID=A0A072P874_9EURO|nr:uncharacterized protein A1O9_07537 [Exophiala aquamarina CBS 119918]KEF55957.1 hypothetical protein A1O9_07537 [Exophiala aquamarina CBS 119918]
MIPNRIQQLNNVVQRVSEPETTKVPVSRWPSPFGFRPCLHLLGVLGAVVVITLNLSYAWIGKELTGKPQDDGRKLLALQLTAKLHELLMNASLANILSSIVLEQLVLGSGVPLGALGTAFLFHDISFLWSKELIAICIAKFKGKAYILPLTILCTILAATIGPSSATVMTPVLTEWPAGNIRFTLNATKEELWPSFLSEATISDMEPYTSASAPGSTDTTWKSIADNMLRFWGHETLGGVFALPESAKVAGKSSVRTLNSRLRGPLTLYQPEYTATTIQTAITADALNALRLDWFPANAYRCTWAGYRLTRGICTYQDIHWSINTHQPVVYTACTRTSTMTATSFPTLARGEDGPKAATVNINSNFDKDSGNSSALEWIDLEGPEFSRTSVGVLVSTNIFSGSPTPETYACSIDAQWGDATIRTSFLGLPYAVDGEPPEFYEPSIHASRYHGRRITISPEWAAQTFSSLLSNTTGTSIFDQLLMTSALPSHAYNASKVEAVLAIALTEQMARIKSRAPNQIISSDANKVHFSAKTESDNTVQASRHHNFTLEVTVTGYGYGLRTAGGISVSSTLAIVTLFAYTLVVAFHMMRQLSSRCYVNSWNNFIDIVVLALNSPAGADMKNTSAGVKTLGVLGFLTSFRAQNGAVQMVIGEKQTSKNALTEKLEREVPYR